MTFSGASVMGRWLQVLPLILGSAIAWTGMTMPAIAEEVYLLRGVRGDVRLLPEGGREQRISSPRRRLRGSDRIRLAGRNSFVRISCPGQGPTAWFSVVGQSRSVREICNPSGLRARGTGTRGGTDDLLAIAENKFIPSTYVNPGQSVLSWPTVDGAQQYHVQILNRFSGKSVWTVETADTQVLYDGDIATGAQYSFVVEAIDGAGDKISQYRLARVFPLPDERAEGLAVDVDEITADRDLSSADRALVLAGRLAAVGETEEEPELWWDVVSVLEGEEKPSSPEVALRLGTAYIHLGRSLEAQEVALQAISMAEDDPWSQVEGLVLLAQGQLLAKQECQAIATLQQAKLLYAELESTDEEEAVAFAIQQVSDRLGDGAEGCGIN